MKKAIINAIVNTASGILMAEGLDAIMSRASKAAQAAHMKKECKDRAYAKLMSAYDSVKRRYDFVAELSNRAPRLSMSAAESMQTMIDMKDLFYADLHAIKCDIIRYADNGHMTDTEVGNLTHLINRLRRFSDATKKAEDEVTKSIAEIGFRKDVSWLTRDVDNVEFTMKKNLEDLREDNFLGKC